MWKRYKGRNRRRRKEEGITEADEKNNLQWHWQIKGKEGEKKRGGNKRYNSVAPSNDRCRFSCWLSFRWVHSVKRPGCDFQHCLQLLPRSRELLQVHSPIRFSGSEWSVKHWESCTACVAVASVFGVTYRGRVFIKSNCRSAPPHGSSNNPQHSFHEIPPDLWTKGDYSGIKSRQVIIISRKSIQFC